MKTLKFPMAIMLGIMGMFIFNSCNTEEMGNVDKKSTLKKVVVSDCETQVRLLAGKTIDVGNVTVWKDADSLYVRYLITDTAWKISQVHIYAGHCDNIPIPPAPGQLGYTSPILDVSEFTKAFPLNNSMYDENGCICIAAHAVVYNCITETSETAWGEGDRISKHGWGMSFKHCKPACVEKCYNYEEQTAWSDGFDYPGGSWAMYTAYDGVEKTVNLLAGQTLLAGTVKFSAPVSGIVTITITLATHWSLKNDSEAVKIQGYTDAPTGKPSAGQFQTYKGTSLVIPVPQYAFYGVHLDVQEQKEIKCPE